MIIAFLGIFLGKLKASADYEVSCQTALSPGILLTQGHTALGHPPGMGLQSSTGPEGLAFLSC